MNLQNLTTFFLPLGLSIIMLGLGLTLTTQDFKRVLLFPKPILIGLVCQLVILPALTFAICFILQLQPEFAIGLVVLASSPGGVTSNVFSHLADGDVALNLTLTAINSLISSITMPLYALLALSVFSNSSMALDFQYKKLVELIFIALIPTLTGMWIKHKAPDSAQASDKYVRWFATLFMTGIILSAIYSQGRYFLEYLPEAGAAVIIFNLLSLAVGYYLPIALRVEKKMARAITFEVGIHNGALALFVAMTVFGGGKYAVPSAFYSILMYITAAVVCWKFKKMSSSKLV